MYLFVEYDNMENEIEVEIEEELKAELTIECPCCKRKIMINIKSSNFIDSILVQKDEDSGIFREVDFITYNDGQITY